MSNYINAVSVKTFQASEKERNRIQSSYVNGTNVVRWHSCSANFNYLKNRAIDHNAVWDGQWWVFPDYDSYTNFLMFPKSHSNLENNVTHEKYKDLNIKIYTRGSYCFFYNRSALLADLFAEHTWVPEEDRHDAKWWSDSIIILPDAQSAINILLDKEVTLKAKSVPVAPVIITVDKWLVCIQCDFSKHPEHGLLLYDEKNIYTNKLHINRCEIWDGNLIVTRSEWLEYWKGRLRQLGIPWKGDDPLSTVIQTPIDTEFLPMYTWGMLANTGYRIAYRYKEYLEKIASLGGRVIINENRKENRLISIGTSEGFSSHRTLILIKNESDFKSWDRLIRNEIDDDEITQLIMPGLDQLNMSAKWTFARYDSIKNQDDLVRKLVESEFNTVILEDVNFIISRGTNRRHVADKLANSASILMALSETPLQAGSKSADSLFSLLHGDAVITQVKELVCRRPKRVDGKKVEDIVMPEFLGDILCSFN